MEMASGPRGAALVAGKPGDSEGTPVPAGAVVELPDDLKALGETSRAEAILRGLGRMIEQVNEAAARLTRAFEQYEALRVAASSAGEGVVDAHMVMDAVAESAYARWLNDSRAPSPGVPKEEVGAWPVREVAEERPWDQETPGE
jgi:hypothetical protein